MVTLRRIGLVSAGRVGFWFSFATNMAFLIFGILMMIMQGIPVTRIPIEFWLRLVLLFVLNGFISSFMTGAMAFIYNMIAKSFGGLQLEFEMLDLPTEKRKNGNKTVEVEIKTDESD